MEIRPLTATDAPEFWQLRLEALESEPQAFGEAAGEHRATPVSSIADRLDAARDGDVVLGAFIDGRLAGTIGFFRNKSLKTRHKGRFWGVYVTPAQRGKGIGRRLLATLLARLRDVPGLELIQLSVNARSSVARNLYAAFGFQEFGFEPAALLVDGESIDEVHMALRLVASSPAPQHL